MPSVSAHVQLGHLNYSNTLLDMNHSLHDLDTFKLYHKHFQDLDIVHFQGWYTISSYTWSAQTWEIEIPHCLPPTNTWVEGARQVRHLWMIHEWLSNLGIHGYLDTLGIRQGSQPQLEVEVAICEWSMDKPGKTISKF